MLDKLAARLEKIGVKLIYTDDVSAYIAKKGVQTGFGARPLSRLITNKIENEITNILINNKYDDLKIKIEISDGELNFDAKHQAGIVI